MSMENKIYMDNIRYKCEELKFDNEKIKCLKEAMIGEAESIMLSDVFKALGDPTRIRMIYILSRMEMCV